MRRHQCYHGNNRTTSEGSKPCQLHELWRLLVAIGVLSTLHEQCYLAKAAEYSCSSAPSAHRRGRTRSPTILLRATSWHVEPLRAMPKTQNHISSFPCEYCPAQLGAAHFECTVRMCASERPRAKALRACIHIYIYMHGRGCICVFTFSVNVYTYITTSIYVYIYICMCEYL